MLKSKRGESGVSNDVVGLIIGAIMVAILFIIFFAFFPARMISHVEKSASSYFDSFNDEIVKAKSGRLGEFIMWQKMKDDSSEVYFIYFDNKYQFKTDKFSFVSFNNKNSFCFCFVEEGIVSCKKEYCGQLDYPVKFNGEQQQLYLSFGQGINIKKSGDYFEIFEIGKESHDCDEGGC